MSENRSYRINTNINKDNVVNVQISQDIDCLEILSLKINQVDTYRLQSANYGVIVGRVLANDGFGVPNVKVSVFVELDKVDREDTDITTIYPYTSMQTRDKDGRKYNLLPDNDNGNGDCYRIIGTFPNKRLVLDNENQLEVFDKYWKYTTVTNSAGDYMIFGVPVGVHTVHIDCDLSDIGILSQKPRDFYYKGYEKTNFENANQFKESTTLEDLVQIISQDKSIQVYPFWGDKDNSDVIALSRCDLNLAYKFEPTCVFMGSVITDDYSNAIGYTCSPSKKVGYNNRLTTNRGTIEMIRKTLDGAVEEYQVQGNELIDGDGVWCYQIPMNLDYIKTDEYGNIVPTDNPNEGIPTRTSARFRISIEDTYNEGIGRHRAKILVPNNLDVEMVGENMKLKDDSEWEKCFQFGSRTPESQYRDLYWNKIYSIKSYIPRIQTNNNVKTHNYSAIRSVNLDTINNPHPFNRIRLHVPFTYTVLCVIMKIVFLLALIINATILSLFNAIADAIQVYIPFYGWWRPLSFLETECITFKFPGVAPDGGDECYIPGCWNKAEGQGGCSTNYKRLSDRLEQALAQEYDVVNLDFYNDWVNGTVYMPLWFWKKTKKKKYLFGLFSKKAVNSFCNCSKNFKKTRIFETCALEKTAKFKPKNGNAKNPDKTKDGFLFRYGVIKEFQNKDGLNVYYYAPGIRDAYYNYGRLYSTDIILLGSFMDCDLDGITNICDKLPPTTANIPFLTTIREQLEDGGDDIFSDVVPGGDSVGGRIEEENLDGSTEDNTILNQAVEITGMDWTYKGKDSDPTYKDGLFFDIGCGKTETRTKTCINLGRMSELGVNLDSGYYVKYPTSNGFKEKYIQPDGMILRHELDDVDTRAAFATMNHSILVGKVESANTKYKSYLLYYTYPMNFDGAMDSAVRAYGVDFDDFQDESYVKFRYGLDVETNRTLNMNQALRYNNKFILTNNSFYFYFGLHPGKTAIEKYQELYSANCLINKKYTQTYDVPIVNSSGCANNGEIIIDFTYIRPPYTITMLYLDEDNIEKQVLFKETGVEGEFESNMVAKCNTAPPIFKYEDKIESEFKKIKITNLTNKDYTLKIVDVNGRETIQLVELNPPIVSINDVVGQQVDIKYIPNSDKKVNGGNIFLGEWVYEGVAITPTTIAPTSGASAYTITVKTTTSEEKKFELRISFKSMYPKDNTEWEISDCIQSVSIIDNKVKFDINIPGYYEFEIQRLCDCNKFDDGVYYDRVLVPNNIQFQLRLNGTPVDTIVSGWSSNWGNNSGAQYPFNVHVADTYYNSDLVPTNPIPNQDEFKLVTDDGKSYVTKDNILILKDYISGLIEIGDDSTFLEGVNAHLSSQIKAKERDLERKEKQKEQYEKIISDKTAEGVEIGGQINIKTSEKTSLENEKNDIERRLNSIPVDGTLLKEQQIQELKNELEELDNGALAYLRELENQERRYELQKDFLNEIIANGDLASDPEYEGGKTLDDYKKELEKVEEELVLIRDQIRVEKGVKEVEEALERYDEILTQISVLEEEIEIIEDTILNKDRLQSQLGELNQQIEDLGDEINSLNNKSQSLKLDIASLNTQIDTLDGEIIALGDEIRTLKSEFTTSVDFDSKISKLKSEIGISSDFSCSGASGCSLYGYINYLESKLKEQSISEEEKLKLQSDLEATNKKLAEKQEELAYLQSLQESYQEFKEEKKAIIKHNLYLVLEFRLKCILQMARGMYTYNGASSPYFKLTTKGGENPCVICSEYPDYGECSAPEEDFLTNPTKASMEQVIHSSSVTKIQGKSSYPTIVPINYGVVANHKDLKKLFNTFATENTNNKLILKGSVNTGNYVAAFDNNMESPYHTQPTNPSPSKDYFSSMTETIHKTINKTHTANFSKTQFIDTSIDYKFTVISPLTKECIIDGINDRLVWGSGSMRGNIIGGVKMKSKNDSILSECTEVIVTGSTCDRPTEYVFYIDETNQYVMLKSLDINHNGKCDDCDKRKKMYACDIYYNKDVEGDEGGISKTTSALTVNNVIDMCDDKTFDNDGFTEPYKVSSFTNANLIKVGNHLYFSKDTYPEITCVKYDEIPSGITNVGVNLSSYSYDIYPELQYSDSGYASGITLTPSVGEELNVKLVSNESLSLSILPSSIIRYDFPIGKNETKYVAAIDCRFKLKTKTTSKSYTKQLIGCRMSTANNSSTNGDNGYINWNDTTYFNTGTFSERIASWEKLTSWANTPPFRLDYSGEGTEYKNGYLRNKETKQYVDDSYIDGEFKLKTSSINQAVNSFAIFAKNSRFEGDESSEDFHLKNITQYQVLKTIDVRPFLLSSLYQQSGSTKIVTGGTISASTNTLIFSEDMLEGVGISSDTTTFILTTISSTTNTYSIRTITPPFTDIEDNPSIDGDREEGGEGEDFTENPGESSGSSSGNSTPSYYYANLYNYIKAYTDSDITKDENVIDTKFYNITAKIRKVGDEYIVQYIKLEFISNIITTVNDDGETICYKFNGLTKNTNSIFSGSHIYVGVTCANGITYLFRWTSYKLNGGVIDCSEAS